MKNFPKKPYTSYLSFFVVLISIFFCKTVVADKNENTTLKIQRILSLEISSSINPATFNYLKSATEKCQKDNYDLLLIKLNTPGGLLSTTKEILGLFGESDIPVAVWITPEGASATSAGAIIASGAHILVMSNGTNIGAATPIEISGDIKDGDLRKKAVNDLVALVKGLAEARKRNSSHFAEMIETAASFSAEKAKENGLIDGIISDQKAFNLFLNDRSIEIKGKSFEIHSNILQIEEFSMDLGQKLLDIFANPSMAYILLLIGAALIYLELQAPGGFIAGSIGTIALILAAIGLHVLPVNFGALGLIGLSFILFILEVYVTSYGLISIAGLSSLLFGSLFLFRTDDTYLAISIPLVISTIAGVGLFLLFIAIFFLKDIRKKKKKNYYSLVGKTGEISQILPALDNGTYLYSIKINGEIWQARSTTKHNINDRCTIIEHNTQNMILKI